jgi:hypothetical protein
VDYWDAGETDVCSVFDCAGPAPVDSGPPPPPPGCPSLADYCARMQGKGCNGGTSLSDVNCDCVATWPTALTSHCGGFNYATRYLNCDGFNAFVGASIEFGGIFYYDATTLALVAIASTGPVTSLPSSTFPAHCLAGEIPQIDPATCASVIAAPPLCGP